MPNILGLADWKVLERKTNDHAMVITAEYTGQLDCCVRCGITPAKLNRHGSEDQGFIDTPVHGKAVAIKVMRKRFKCVDCGKTFQEPLPDMDEKRHMTRRLSTRPCGRRRSDERVKGCVVWTTFRGDGRAVLAPLLMCLRAHILAWGLPR